MRRPQSLPARRVCPANPFGSCPIRFEFCRSTFKINIIEPTKVLGYDSGMTDEKPQYKWPRYALAAVIVFLVSAIIWVVIEAHKVQREHNFNAPIQTQ